MKDLLIQARFRNNILWQLMSGASVAELSRTSGVSQPEIGKLLNLRTSPLKLDGTYISSARRLADYFAYPPKDLFPAALYALRLPRSLEKTYASEDMLPLLAAKNMATLDDPETLFLSGGLRADVQEVLAQLTPRQCLVLEHRLGLNGKKLTLKQVGAILGVTGNRVMQIEFQVLNELRGRKGMRLRQYARKDLDTCSFIIEEATQEKDL